MSIECQILERLKKFPCSSTMDIAKGINQHRYKVVLSVARLLWRQQIQMDGYTKPLDGGQQRPLYSAISHNEVNA